MNVFVVNCGSSSIKFRLFDMPGGAARSKGAVERIGEPEATLTLEIDGAQRREPARAETHEQGMGLILRALLEDGGDSVLNDPSDIGAVGHRVVHGGESFTGSVRIDQAVLDAIQRAADLAPLHNPPNLAGIRATMRVLPDATQVACFDTAFHATLPRHAYLYALPYELYEEHGIRRYGFHGTSHRYVARRAAELLGVEKHAFNGITCHLGNGCSIAAIRDGRSVDTSMGLTPLEGLVMGTRAGDFDPAILLHLQNLGHSAADLATLCNKRSGLLGLSGLSNDMRALHEAASNGNERARLSLDVFAYRIKKYVGAYTAVLGRVDAVVFTGGIGEHDAEVRAAVCDGLEPLGITIDPERNGEEATGDRRISAETGRFAVLVIGTDEEGAIAADTYRIAST